ADLTPSAGSTIGAGQDDTPNLPVRFDLAQNYPNPFNPNTTIEFSVNQSAQVQLSIYNVSGQRVTTLLDDYVEAGTTTLDWNGTTSSGTTAVSGIYFYGLSIDGNEQTKKMVLLR
ncbi:MAG: hypothetical protein DRP45_11580, partial [Candidatus Zixiibacteriota bacterium]